MTNPKKVIGFLDLFGNWDPSLMLVMGAAIPITFIAFRWLEKKQTTVLNEPIHLPGKKHIDFPLIGGGVIFGVGWALAGYCPGPAIVSIGLGNGDVMYFFVAMVVGMKLVEIVQKK